ncbi:hypothetical protein H4R34_001493 [Dimargaris verticillata]|uniref:Arf-GAP domain-containing protein n=1 Tax=Dimargaris verticillata TaxID=2761393 RepID=A0A9W8EAV8_9FUNG|nr:hypothetical protein H4R34_001493 [Dimargaris verticillata]
MSRKLADKHTRILRDMMKLHENRYCFDCGSTLPSYANLFNHTFICERCSGLHRELNHRVKSISASIFTAAEVKALMDGGNAKATRIWLAKWTARDYPLPENGNLDLIKEFIRQKYVRRRWVDESLLKSFTTNPSTEMTSGSGNQSPRRLKPPASHSSSIRQSESRTSGDSGVFSSGDSRTPTTQPSPLLAKPPSSQVQSLARQPTLHKVRSMPMLKEQRSVTWSQQSAVPNVLAQPNPPVPTVSAHPVQAPYNPFFMARGHTMPGNFNNGGTQPYALTVAPLSAVSATVVSSGPVSAAPLSLSQALPAPLIPSTAPFQSFTTMTAATQRPFQSAGMTLPAGSCHGIASNAPPAQLPQSRIDPGNPFASLGFSAARSPPPPPLQPTPIEPFEQQQRTDPWLSLATRQQVPIHTLQPVSAMSFSLVNRPQGPTSSTGGTFHPTVLTDAPKPRRTVTDPDPFASLNPFANSTASGLNPSGPPTHQPSSTLSYSSAAPVPLPLGKAALPTPSSPSPRLGQAMGVPPVTSIFSAQPVTTRAQVPLHPWEGQTPSSAAAPPLYSSLTGGSVSGVPSSNPFTPAPSQAFALTPQPTPLNGATHPFSTATGGGIGPTNPFFTASPYVADPAKTADHRPVGMYRMASN